jgi:hypothetical protein
MMETKPKDNDSDENKRYRRILARTYRAILLWSVRSKNEGRIKQIHPAKKSKR